MGNSGVSGCEEKAPAAPLHRVPAHRCPRENRERNDDDASRSDRALRTAIAISTST